MRRLFYFSLAVHLLVAFNLSAASHGREGPEDFRLELTGSAWMTGPTGKITADGTPIDFVSDLGAGSHEPKFYGRLVYKPGRKHLLIIEGTPISFSGRNTIQRSFVFANHTYSVSQTVATKANVDYVFGGYQYDPLSNRFGHLGFQIGVAYLGGQGTLRALESGINESRNGKIPVPLIGTEFRIFPVPHHKVIELEGMMRGLPAGGYGYFVEGSADGGIRLGPISVLAGYREMFANVHQNHDLSNGAAFRLKGPIFSVQWQW